ncbi:sensor histidine kinase [Thermaerobacter sp. PB12/4term]|uniref:sensor histidine kinase n=1 Tax=Thermaerobacter sp. PB12/4term TaxID=2293838 RepID=UPI000E329135|nr:sensor histidine kinase [Thermaerobacter sp. PB12/4term]QIA27892.1 sensor histidine kinase [Thermaerobacter sp. PB12/4term]
MDPWKTGEQDGWNDAGFHLIRLALFAAGTAVWLLNRAQPAPGVAVALASGLVLQALAEAAGGARARDDGRGPRRWTAVAAGAGALVLTLWAATCGGDAALIGTVAAVLMGSPTVMGRGAARWVNGAAVVATTAAAAQGSGLQGALLAGAVLLVAGWSGDMHASYRAERERLQQVVAGLAAAQDRLTELAARSGELGAQREREELLGTLHDALGHALTAQLLQVSLARRLLSTEPEAAAARLEAVEAGLRDGLAQVRQLLRRSLHPVRLPLASAVQRLASDFGAASGVEVEVVFEPDAASVSDTDPAVTGAVYRAVQEALTNAARHGQARHVLVSLTATGRRLRLRVQDDGLGAAELVPGVGLTRMTRTVQRLGGTLRFETRAARGFAVEITVPRRAPMAVAETTGSAGEAGDEQ